LGSRRGGHVLKNTVGLMILKGFQGFAACEHETEETFMTLSRWDSLVGTVVSCLTELEGRGGRGQRRFQELFTRFLPLATHQIKCGRLWS